MGAHVAAGLPFAGHEADRLPVLFVSLEDEPSIVRLRLRRIIESYRLDAGEVLPRMSLLDGTQAFSALMTEGDGFSAPPQFTQAFRELAEQAQGAGLIIIDNASDAFDANETAGARPRFRPWLGCNCSQAQCRRGAAGAYRQGRSAERWPGQQLQRLNCLA